MSDSKKRGAVIGCDAENCEFNEHGASCTASRIRVDGRAAHTTGETCCSTFREKQAKS